MAGLIGAMLVLGVGLFLVADNRLAALLRMASYDWSYDLSLSRPSKWSSEDVMLIYLDEQSYRLLRQPLDKPWDRALHAQLLDRLTQDGAKVVVFDVVFSDPGPSPAADEALAQATLIRMYQQSLR